MAAPLVNIRTAPLDAVYALAPEPPVNPAMEEMLTIDPPPFSFSDRHKTVFIPKKVPVTLIAITLFHRSIEVSSKRVSGEIPALFTKNVDSSVLFNHLCDNVLPLLFR